MAEQKRLWKTVTPDGMRVEISRDDEAWTVVAAATVRSRQHSLHAALRESVGHLTDEKWIASLCRSLEPTTPTPPR